MDEFRLVNGFYMLFCVMMDCLDDMIVVKEEIFGFVMIVLLFDIEEEVVNRVNDIYFGLVVGVFIK